MAHPGTNAEKEKVLTELKLMDLHRNQEWGKIHAAILELYRASLADLEKAIS
jgi:hypothetical protein